MINFCVQIVVNSSTFLLNSVFLYILTTRARLHEANELLVLSNLFIAIFGSILITLKSISVFQSDYFWNFTSCSIQTFTFPFFETLSSLFVLCLSVNRFIAVKSSDFYYKLFNRNFLIRTITVLVLFSFLVALIFTLFECLNFFSMKFSFFVFKAVLYLSCLLSVFITYRRLDCHFNHPFLAPLSDWTILHSPKDRFVYGKSEARTLCHISAPTNYQKPTKRIPKIVIIQECEARNPIAGLSETAPILSPIGPLTLENFNLCNPPPVATIQVQAEMEIEPAHQFSKIK